MKSEEPLSRIKIIALVVSFGFLFFMMWLTSHKEEPKLAEPKSQAQQVQAVSSPAYGMNDYGDKHSEMLHAFNDLFSDNNFKTIYSGVSHRISDDTLIVKVNDKWNYVSKDVKSSFLEASFKSWDMMANARKLNFKSTNFHVKIVHDTSGRDLASWDSISGPSVKD